MLLYTVLYVEFTGRKNNQNCWTGKGVLALLPLTQSLIHFYAPNLSLEPSITLSLSYSCLKLIYIICFNGLTYVIGFLLFEWSSSASISCLLLSLSQLCGLFLYQFPKAMLLLLVSSDHTVDFSGESCRTLTWNIMVPYILSFRNLVNGNSFSRTI